MHPQGRIQKPKAQVQVDLKQAETLQCEKCTNIQVYSCGNCGHVPSKLLEGTDITGKELGEEEADS